MKTLQLQLPQMQLASQSPSDQHEKEAGAVVAVEAEVVVEPSGQCH